MKFRRRRRSFSRRRGMTYEIQDAPFSRVPIESFPGSTAALPTSDLFLICHPRLEWRSGPTGGDTANVPAIARGCIVRGLRHKLLISYFPDGNENPSATGVGAVTIRAAIVRLATDPSVNPFTVPNLFENTIADSSGSQSQPTYRIMWLNIYQVPVLDGTTASNLIQTPASTQALMASNEYGNTTTDLHHTKTAVRLGMDQGLYLLVQNVCPFASANTGIVMGMDAHFRYGVKQLLTGPNSYQ